MRVEKIVAFYSSTDRAISEPLGSAGKSARRYPGFAEALARHTAAWGELWRACDMTLPENERVQLLLRLHIAHVLQVCSRHTADYDAGVPARGLNGEAYRGHIFWDELYVYPFLNFRLPEITRELLMYRYRRLGRGARGGARGRLPRRDVPVAERQRRHRGDPGRPPQPALGPLGARPVSHNQRHVNAAIFYNIWHYYQATDDADFLREHGAEMMLEIARFWASIAHFNPERDRYEIHGVMGPDEFHEKYPGAAEGGLRNNAYTNVMVAWIADTAQRVLAMLPDEPARRAARPARARRRRDRRVGGDEPQDVRPVPRRRHHQPVRGLRGPRGAGLGRATGPSTATSSGSIASCAPRARIPTATSWPSRPTR